MEVGAVKQAFNNEIILLKKKLNQAKIHVIHKLTRKAKTFTDKKAPDHLKEKLKRKAESAVNEVLIIKKIKPRDIAKFMITHTGQLSDYLNTPKVDNDKACARLILHKSLQDKYKFIRNRFGNVPIKDLFMSRQERRKLKKEAREDQKNKKKGKVKNANAAGHFDVENMDDDKNISKNDSDGEDHNDIDHSESERNKESEDNDNVEADSNSEVDDDMNSDDHNSDNDSISVKDNADEHNDSSNEIDEDDSDGVEENTGNFIKLNPEKGRKSVIKQQIPQKSKSIKNNTRIDTFEPIEKEKNDNKMKAKKRDTKVKDNKNKNLKEKLQNRQFKKDKNVTEIEGRKVVDPFFITASGENYLSLAEPRQPDEVKEIHRQGNRQERRAAMFGHNIKNKPRRNNIKSNKFEQDGYNNGPRSEFRHNNDKFNSSNVHNKLNDKSYKFNDSNSKFNDRNQKFNGRNNKFDDSQNRHSFNNNEEKKEEKLHPSWEAKRKLKSISLLPAQGKKIVFNDG